MFLMATKSHLIPKKYFPTVKDGHTWMSQDMQVVTGFPHV